MAPRQSEFPFGDLTLVSPFGLDFAREVAEARIATCSASLRTPARTSGFALVSQSDSARDEGACAIRCAGRRSAVEDSKSRSEAGLKQLFPGSQESDVLKKAFAN